MRPSFIRIPRTNGTHALVRADMITAILPQEKKGGGVENTIQVGATIAVHTTLSEDAIARAVLSATGHTMVIIDPE